MNVNFRPVADGHQSKSAGSAVLQLADIQYFSPIQIKRRSGCKKVVLPNGETAKPKDWNAKATPLQLALARGQPSVAMQKVGKVKSLKEIADRENIDNSYVSRMVNLTCLSHDIVAAILEDELSDQITLFGVAVDPSLLWEAQSRQHAVHSY